MDPNETLRRLRELLTRVADEDSMAAGSFEAAAEASIDDYREIASLFEALDGWLSKGGFLPQGWARPINALEGLKMQADHVPEALRGEARTLYVAMDTACLGAKVLLGRMVKQAVTIQELREDREP